MLSWFGTEALAEGAVSDVMLSGTEALFEGILF